MSATKKSIEDALEHAFQMLSNISNGNILRSNIQTASLFVLFFESFKDFAVNSLKNCYCYDELRIDNGRITAKESDTYKKEVRSFNRKDALAASLCWYKEAGALSDQDVQTLLNIRMRRNILVHELHSVLLTGLTPQDKEMLDQLISLYQKLDFWWLENIEIPTREGIEAEGCDITPENTYSLAWMSLDMIYHVATGDVEQFSCWQEQIQMMKDKIMNKSYSSTTEQEDE